MLQAHKPCNTTPVAGIKMKKARKKQLQYGAVLLLILCIISVGVVWGLHYISSKSIENNSEPEQSEDLLPSYEDEEPQIIPDPVEESVQNQETLLPEKTEEELRMEQAYENAQTYLDGMSLEEKVSQLFLVTPEALTKVGTVIAAGETTREALGQYPVGGLIYFDKNLNTTEQTTEMLANTQSYALELNKLPLFLAVDEEGGSVTRLAGKSGFSIDPVRDMCDIGATGGSDEAYQTGTYIGSYLKELGFNLDFAPDTDVYSNPENQVVKKRSFGTNPELVTEMSAAYYQGLSENSILGCYKHFPGHGSTAGDTHDGFAASQKDWSELLSCDLLPFSDGIEQKIPFIMVGHISFPNVTSDDIPASLSKEIIQDKIRDEMGYQGIIITDALNMGAVTEKYDSGQVAMAAFNAGADMLLMPQDFNQAEEAMLAAVKSGEISEDRLDESVKRILYTKMLYLVE